MHSIRWHCDSHDSALCRISIALLGTIWEQLGEGVHLQDKRSSSIRQLGLAIVRYDFVRGVDGKLFGVVCVIRADGLLIRGRVDWIALAFDCFVVEC